MADALVLDVNEEDQQEEGEELEDHLEVEVSENAEGEKQGQPRMMAPAVISIHPESRFAVVSVGAGFRVFDIESNVQVVATDTTSPSAHRAAIRAARFNLDGTCFFSAGDDKLVKLWDVQTWTCSRSILVNKKISAGTFSRDGQWLLVADKFGVVYVIPTCGQEKCETGDEPAQLLAHCCSIITSLEISPCGKYVATADRDFKIRVTVLPPKPDHGAYEIQSFCLGHTSFVSCLAFVTDSSSSQTLLVSGGGDATIRLWDYVSGSQVDCMKIPDALQVEGDASVVNVSTHGSTIAATIERFPGVLLLSCDTKLSVLQTILLQEPIYPTGLHFDKERLWLIAGGAETRDVGDRVLTPQQVEEMASAAQAAAAAALTRVRVVQKLQSHSEYHPLDDESVPGALALLNALQGRLSDSSTSVAEAVALAAEAAELAMKNLLSKRQYTEVQRERRKRSRNDKKIQA